MNSAKQTEHNRKSLRRLISKLVELREDSEDVSIKRRLRALEEKLSLSAPVSSSEAEETDAELFSIMGEFKNVQLEGILTQRYLERMEMLINRRTSLN